MTPPSGKEGNLQQRKEAYHGVHDDEAEDQSFHTTASSPTTLNQGASEPSVPTQLKAVPHQGHL